MKEKHVDRLDHSIKQVDQGSGALSPVPTNVMISNVCLVASDKDVSEQRVQEKINELRTKYPIAACYPRTNTVYGSEGSR